MSTPSQPTSSKRRKPLSGSFAIRFAPGQPQSDQVFNNIPDIVEYIRDQTDSDVTVYVDLTAVGGTYILPVRTDYDFRRVFLDGFFNDDGSIPVLIFPEGAKIIDDCNFIRKKDVDFACAATSTIPWTPNSPSRMEDETAAGYLSTTNTVPFVSTENGCTLLTYQGGPGCGLLSFGGAELIYADDSTTLRIFARQTCEIIDDTIASSSLSIVDIRMSPEAYLGAQPLNLSSNLNLTGDEQSGSIFPPLAFPGKLYHLTTDDRVYVRNADNTDWLPLAEQVQHDWQPSLVSNAVALSFVNKHNFNVSVVSGEDYEIDVSFGWNYQEAKKGTLVQLLINGVQQGRSDGVATYFMKDAPVVVEAPVVAGTGNSERCGFSRKIRYTATTTGFIPIVLRFAPAETKIAAMWDSLITVRRIS